jgi:ATP-dependent DNA helicase
MKTQSIGASEEELEKKREQRQEKKAAVKAAGPQRKSARAAVDEEVAAPKADHKGAKGSRSLPSRTKKAKAEDKLADHIKVEDLEAKVGSTTVADALEEAAAEAGDSPSALGKQNLRSAAQPKLVTGGVMRSYQLEGLQWLRSLYENGLNGILADEMGLGKTLQTISFIAFLREMGTNGPFLVAAPLSTLSNWVDEFHRFTPDIPVMLYHGSKDDRERLRSEHNFRNPGSASFPVICTSYDICMNDAKYLRNIDWKFIIIDEGHRLKNMNCKLIQELKTYPSANRLLITGTPLQNDLLELWSLLNFLMPEIFNNVAEFQSWFDFSALKDRDGHKEILSGERKSNLVTSLHAILKPFLLRRVKTDVETDLPPKREYILYAQLSAEQREIYKTILHGDIRQHLEQKVVDRINEASPRSSRSVSLKRKARSVESSPNKSTKGSRSSTPRSTRGRKSNRKSYKELDDEEWFDKLSEGESEHELDGDEIEEIERANTIKQASKCLRT